METPAWMKKRGPESRDDAAAEAKVARKEIAAAAKKGGDAAMRELLVVLTKLVLSDSRCLAEVVGTVYRTWEVDLKGDEHVGLALEAAGKDYNTESERLRKERQEGGSPDFESRGPPHVHVFVAFLQWAGKQELGEHKAPLMDFWNNVIVTLEPLKIAERVPYFKWRRNKGPGGVLQDKGRIQLAFDQTDSDMQVFTKLFDAIMVKQGAKRRVGAAPKGPLERDAGRLLAAMVSK
ncbi:unnamed protein product [Prorocentrum cordatum]|uniref:Uncharacterized protein n=1 Tax=Prorocentrum cordatum TaxID=2364126 RepID=A0ABN9XGP3_9DINO|nr:unnamed protein product [Polarella glacialis]